MPPPMRSIGQVLNTLKPEFPDISISKIRFLESEGLLSPERAPSGYRKYAQVDIDRLAYILRVQRDHYLPLKVIKEHLDVMDAGGEPPTLEAPPSQPTPLATPAPEHRPDSGPTRSKNTPIRLTRRELVSTSGISEALLLDLERQQLVAPKRGANYYGREALTICVVAQRLAPYGMDVRHLRAIKQAAEREAGLVEQAIAPYVRRRAHASEAASEVTRLVLHAHAAMMHTLLER
ncbi:MerR family transcriptional regulator [Aestuariimicrobium sp. p3-SID1156]|uniref:transcriptional regulator FtsR n=1 Tax=Aestuariimicrobium sp. p3-SID1156 TaxID=2916038 RepID=UPI00223B0E3C|nr:MerR family transcriptional regulator [Aestuariimicrobium sp. p3-SID1156]MCT1459008.1 MerR family transcriptional regulator [Aestuariimicrobium sp. p3-SID1156]